MANDQINLYNFYRRYRWRAEDFTGWQEGMVDHSRGMFEGLVNGAVLLGFGAATGGGNAITVSEGIASGPTGYLHVINEVTDLELDAVAGAGLLRRDLVVVRPSLVDGDYITNPTNPFQQVPLTTAQESAIVVIKGVESNSPVYPAVEVNDVILFGVRLEEGVADIYPEDFDFEVRDLIGKNSNIQQDAGKFDDRLRPYKSTNKILGVKPSQLEPPFARVFSYVNRANPSIFPKDIAGMYNPEDTFINLETGAITGGDETTSDFTPTIPAAGQSIVAAISLFSDDTLSVSYGEEGTRQQCISGIKNQIVEGAGSCVITEDTKPVAFVVVTSLDGAIVADIEFFDCRGGAGIGGGAGGGAGLASGGYTLLTGPSYNLIADDNGKVFGWNSNSTTIDFNLFTAAPGFTFILKDIGGNAQNNPLTVQYDGLADIEGLAQDYICDAPNGIWTFIFDGADWYIL